MTTCDWPECGAAATHHVEITFPGQATEPWDVCRGHDRELKIRAVRGRPKEPPDAVESVPNVVRCGACGALLDEPSDIAPENRSPCPNCHSTSRKVEVYLSERIAFHDSFRARTKTPATKGGWMLDTRSGDDYSNDLQGWGKRELTKDRGQDLYREVIELWDSTRIESTAKLSDHHD